MVPSFLNSILVGEIIDFSIFLLVFEFVLRVNNNFTIRNKLCGLAMIFVIIM